MTIEQALSKWSELLPLSTKDRERLARRFSIDFNYNSNHIEGNTLTYGQTEILLLFGQVSGNSDFHYVEEMKASNVGMKLMLEEAINKEIPLTENFIRSLHKILLREDYVVYHNLPNEQTSSYTIHAGRYKTRPNSVITRYGDRFEYASPQETPALMYELVSWYNKVEQEGKYTPFELATLFHYRYIQIHPFEDGNGRIARLLVNYILSRHDMPLLVVRSRNKQDYLESLHKADLIVGSSPSNGVKASLRQIRSFATYFRKLYVEEILSNIAFVTEKDENIWWFDGIKLNFKAKTTPQLLRLLQIEPLITISEISEIIGISKAAVSKQISLLSAKGYIIRKEENSEWYVVCTPAVD